ncbi:hypothetical protein NL676_025937 [Syzygium grande]|nr:hypothetical protein NL676_025937 [Syzygium grande]
MKSTIEKYKSGRGIIRIAENREDQNIRWRGREGGASGFWSDRRRGVVSALPLETKAGKRVRFWGPVEKSETPVFVEKRGVWDCGGFSEVLLVGKEFPAEPKRLARGRGAPRGAAILDSCGGGGGGWQSAMVAAVVRRAVVTNDW